MFPDNLFRSQNWDQLHPEFNCQDLDMRSPVSTWLTHFFQEILFFFFLILLVYLFIYFWLCWVLVSVRGLSLAVANGGHSSSRCAGLSLSQPLLLRSTGSRCAGSVVVAHGPSCSAASGILPDQGSNPCALHWQADSQPLRHQGSPFQEILTQENNAVKLQITSENS